MTTAQHETPRHESTDPSVAPLLQRRRNTLGTHSPLFYDEPLHLVSGRGAYVTDAAGRRYLDAYNNVPHVGHAHPAVAEAVFAQMSTLNINTRYLNERVVDYAEDLLSTFDPRLDRLALVNSGSEANELALRMARQRTGHEGVLVSDYSYHGNTRIWAELATGLDNAEPFPDYGRAITVPDATGLDEDAAAELLRTSLAAVDAAIASLQESGHGVATVLVDPSYSTEGLRQPPAGWLAGVVERVRSAGGTFISDEVQTGFGRLGAWWGHQVADVHPDFVALGKPMGNGHPLGGVVTSSEVLEEFGARNTYFNTFAGTPVSAAAGSAVLGVVRSEGLVDSARELGEVVEAGLAEITASSDRVARHRGRGLYRGLDLVDPATGRPDPAAAKQVVERMRRAGVLISRIGPDESVLKIRPTLAVRRPEVDLLVSRLGEVVAALG